MHIHSGNVDEFAPRVVRVFLDGNELDCGFVTEANEEGGYIVFTVNAKDGSFFVDPRTDDVRTIKLIGRVDITLGGADLSPKQYSDIAMLFHKRHCKAS